MPSNEWEYFMDNFFGDPYMMWHDGIDPTAASRLQGEERTKAEKMLIESMNRGNYWAPMGLREMKSKKAIPYMKELIETAYSRLGIEIAVALNVIENTTDYVPYLIHALQNVSSPYDRFAAAIALREFGTPEAIDALFEAIKDPDYLVRNHASESLLAIHGLEPTISKHDEIFGFICTDSEDEGSYKKALMSFEKAIVLLKQLFVTNEKMK
jgi:hypothetical protein